MPFLDFIKNRNAVGQQAVAPAPQVKTPAAKSVESLPDHVKSAAVEAARPTAEIAGAGAAPNDAPVQPQATPRASRGRSLRWER